jgi:hypothetical protein
MMADGTVDRLAGPDSRNTEVTSIRDLVDEEEGWPLERYVYTAGTDWLRLWDAWIIVGLTFIEVMLAFRLGFKLAAANATNGFVGLVYDITGPIAAPFDGIVAATKLGSDGSFDPSILVAMAVYLAGAILLMSLGWAIAVTERSRPHHDGPAVQQDVHLS